MPGLTRPSMAGESQLRSPSMIQAERQRVIKSLLAQNGIVTIADLAQHLGISHITIRRDIQRMEEQGDLVRTRGGATVRNTAQNEFPSYEAREVRNVREKEAIARKAATFVQDGDSLIISAGTTTHALAVELRRLRNLTVFTNGLTIATELTHSPDVQVFVPGGTVDFKNHGTTGPSVEEVIRGVHVPKAFLAATGVSLEHGVSMHSPTAARVHASFVTGAREVTLLVDATKFDAPSLFAVCPVTGLHRIITDKGIQPETRTAFEARGVEIVIADE